MHLKSVFPTIHGKRWLPLRSPFNVFDNKCWCEFDTKETKELFKDGSNIIKAIYTVSRYLPEYPTYH